MDAFLQTLSPIRGIVCKNRLDLCFIQQTKGRSLGRCWIGGCRYGMDNCIALNQLLDLIGKIIPADFSFIGEMKNARVPS